MTMIRFTLMAVTMLSASISALSQKQEAIRVSIPQIYANPLKYDGRVVRVNGYVLSNRLGVVITGERRVIRLRSPDKVESPMVQRDRLFKKFWRTAKSEIGPETIWVEFDGLIRVSKGKRPIDYFGEWPVVELIPVHIIRIVRTRR